MKKNKIFLIFIYIYLSIFLIFPTYTNLLNIVSIIYLIINFIYLKLNRIKFNKLDLILLIIPLGYLFTIIFKLNLSSILDNVFAIICNLNIALLIINIRRIINKNNIKSILNFITIITIVSFIISIIAYKYSNIFKIVKIYSYFTDTYVNSIDRYYGLLCYCNATAVLFLVSFYILLFKNKKNIFNYLGLYISFIGFSYTFSKMISICFIIGITIYTIYSIICKKYDDLKDKLFNIIILLIPICFSITTLRTYLISYNFFRYVISNLLIFIIYYIVVYFVNNKNKIKYILCIISICLICYFTLNPYYISLRINNISKDNKYYITEFILNDNKTYNINIDYKLYKGNVEFVLERGYLVNNYLITEDYLKLDKNNNFKVTKDKNTEYYLLKISGLNKNTDVKINKITINNKIQFINTLIVPYQITRQLALTKYDRESMNGRFMYYRDSLEYLKNRYYIFGGGVDTFKVYRKRYFDNRYNELNPHSILFEYWLDIGIFGVIYLLYIYISSICIIIKKRNNYDMSLLFLVYISIVMFSSLDFYLHIYLFRFIMLLFYVFILDYNKYV